MKKEIQVKKGGRNQVSTGGGILTPLVILILLLSLCLWNGYAISTHSRQWQEQAQHTENLIRRGDSNGAEAVLSESYRDWRKQWTYLHVICRHDAVDGADELYRRCLILIQSDTPADVLPELSSLREQLDNLSDMERLSIENIL